MKNSVLEDGVEHAFQVLYESIMKSGDLAFPSKDVIEKWEIILDNWIIDSELPLLVRRPSKIRGSITVHASQRKLLVSDNTPAHWVYKNVVLDKSFPTINMIKAAFNSFSFPLAIMRKKTEIGYLKDSQIAAPAFRLGGTDWKVAHIHPITLPRTKNLSIQDHIDHHRKFLSLRNVYLIKKKYSGLSEVKMFNDIVSKMYNSL